VVVLGSTDRLHEELASSAKSTPPGSPSIAAPVADGDGRLDLKAIARKAARDAERLVISDTLDRVHWNRAKAARILQISYKALLYKIVDCGLAHVSESPLGAGEILAGSVPSMPAGRV
jgi:DNA-binding NtrC family response regulator